MTTDRDRQESPMPKTDSEKLTTLAMWFDVLDDEKGYTGPREVQADLRRIASALAARTPPPLGHVLCKADSLPKTADGVPMFLGDTVYVVQSLAGFADPKWTRRPPLDEITPVLEVTVANIGRLGHPSQRVTFIERHASFTIQVDPASVFSTCAAAESAREAKR